MPMSYSMGRLEVWVYVCNLKKKKKKKKQKCEKKEEKKRRKKKIEKKSDEKYLFLSRNNKVSFNYICSMFYFKNVNNVMCFHYSMGKVEEVGGFAMFEYHTWFTYIT